MSNTSPIAAEIQDRLKRVRVHFYKTDAKAQILRFGAFALIALSLLAFLELVFQFNSAIRTIVFINVLIAFTGATAWYVLRPLFRVAGILQVEDDIAVARRVGDRFPPIQDRLINFLQLHHEALKADTLYSRDLLEASFGDIAAATQTIDFDRAVDESMVSRMRKWFAASASGAAFLLLCFPSSMPGAFYRLAHFEREFVPPPRYVFDVSPGSKEIVKGDQVEIRVKLVSPTQRLAGIPSLEFHSRPKGQDRFDQISMKQDSVGLYSTVLRNVKVSTEYRIRVLDAQSQLYVLTVMDRPLIRSLKVRLDPPAYSKLPARMQDEFMGDVTGLAGTRVFVEGTSSKDLNVANIVFGRDSASEMKISGTKFSGQFALKEDGTYHIELTDNDSLINLDPVRYALKIVPDESPTVSILEPGRNLDIAGDQSIPMLIRATDDFGFTQLRLGYRLVHSRYQEGQKDYSYLPIPISGEQHTELEASYSWNLGKLDLVPEDVVEYFAEVFDNDVVKGPKSARSALFLLRLPSLEEVFSDVNQGHEQTIEEIKKAVEDTKKLKEDVESINIDIKKNKDIDWQKQKKMEELTKKYQDIQKKLQSAEKQLDQMVQKMEQQSVLSKETMEKYMELQQVLQELNSSELQQALKQMQQAMQNVNKDQLQQAMQQVQFSEERFRQGIERTLELLKRIQIEQKVDEVKKRAQELEQSQKEIKDATSKPTNETERQELARKQEDLVKKEQQLEQESSDLAKRMEEFFGEMPVDKLNALNQKLRQQQLSQQMKNAAQQMKQGQSEQAQQSQEQIQQGLQEFSQQMDAMQQEMLQQQAQHTLNALRKATNDLLELSKREEELKQQSQSAAPNSPQLRQNAEDQQGVMQDLGNIVNGLSELSKKSFAVTPEMGKAIGEALARMQNAMRGLDVRNGQMASQEQGSAMGSLNNAAVQVQNALQALMQGGQGGAGGLMQQLQLLAGQQMSLNMRSQQLSQGMSMQQAAEAARLAKEQDAIWKSLDQLNKEAQASQDQKKLLGDLGKIGEEMKEVVKNLEQNNVNPETIKQQERILSRLLDASKSMRERDYEKKRKAQTGTEIARKSPKDLDLQDLNGMNKLREDLMKALEQGYSKDFQDLIRRYFEELQKTEKIENN